MSNAADGLAIRRRPLGRTGLMVGELGFGAWAIGGGFQVNGQGMGYGTTDDQVSLAALARAFELGVNFVDTADTYGAGHSETLIGRALKLAPRRVHVATKAGNVLRDSEPPRKDFSAKHLRQACDRSLSRLGVTCIDLYQLHNPPREVLADPQVWDTLRELKDRGKIAHYGVSISAPEEGLLALEKGEVEAIQVCYHLLNSLAAQELFPLAEKKGVGIIVREPLANGILSGKYRPGHLFSETDHRRQTFSAEKLAAALQRVEALRFLSLDTQRTLAQAALQFTLAHEAVSVVIPGIRTPQQAEENVAAASSTVPGLSAEELARIQAA